MKANVFIILCLLSMLCSCQRPSQITVQKLDGNLWYERLLDVNGGTRVILLKESANGSEWTIIIPGDVVWCESNYDLIFGEKRSNSKPTTWMGDDWKKEGFFTITPSKLNSNAVDDEAILGNAVRWYSSKHEMEQHLREPN